MDIESDLLLLRLTSTGGGSDWAIPMAQRLKYGQMFTNSDKSRKQFLTGKS